MIIIIIIYIYTQLKKCLDVRARVCVCVCLNDCFAFLDTNHLLRHLVMKRTVWCTGKCHLHCLPLITALSWLMANVCLAPPWLQHFLSGQHPEFVLQVLIQQHHCCPVVPLTHVISACENVHQPLLEEILITMLRELHPTHHELNMICFTKFLENILAKSVGQPPVAGPPAPAVRRIGPQQVS